MAFWGLSSSVGSERARERAPGLVRDGVDRLALRAPVRVVDPVALIMAAHEADLNELRHGAADVCAPRLSDALADLFPDERLSQQRVGGKLVGCLQLSADLMCKRQPAWVRRATGAIASQSQSRIGRRRSPSRT
jgi:hypothetical protein